MNNVAVLPEYRHKGIGRMLIDHAFAIAKDYGCNVMNIGIVEENVRLRAWYEKAGQKDLLKDVKREKTNWLRLSMHSYLQADLRKW